MSAQEFGPLRSKAARKPWPECPDIRLYRCPLCGRQLQSMGWTLVEQAPFCCGAAMEHLHPRPQESEAAWGAVHYAIVGGFNHSAVQIFWDAAHAESRPEWALLKTFTGSSCKYVGAKKSPPLVFALADEDAYVYCDRSQCEQCVFRCKKGFMLYLYYTNLGLLEIPLDTMAGYFKEKT